MANLREKYLTIEYSVCVITGKKVELHNMADPSRNNRITPNDEDIQLGHNVPMF